MSAKMMEKVNNLRAMIGENGVLYDVLERMTYRNDSVPSIATLRKYGLLKVVREEEYEDTMTEEEWDNHDMYYDYTSADWNWDEKRELYVCFGIIRFYGIE